MRKFKKPYKYYEKETSNRMISKVITCVLFLLMLIIILAIYFSSKEKAIASDIDYEPSNGVGRTEIQIFDKEKEYYDVPLSKNIQDYIIDLCNNEYDNVPTELVLSLIEKESSFRVDAVGKTNDYGLCQINKVNHKWLKETLGVTDIMDPYQNILCSVYMLSDYLYKTNGNIEKALMCYNQGEKSASISWSNGVESTPYSEHIYNNYVSLIKNKSIVGY